MPKISELPLANKLKEEDYIPIVQDGVTKKVKGTHFVTEEEYSLDAFSPTITANDKAMYKFGEGDTVDFSDSAYDGAYKSAILKGNTLVNLVGNTGTKTLNSTSRFYNLNPTYTLEINKKHLLITNIKSITLGGYDLGLKMQIGNQHFNISKKDGLIKKILEITDTSDIACRFYLDNHDANNGSMVELEDTMLIPYQDGMENWDIPYFEGMQSVKMPVLTTTGKNLFSGIHTQTTDLYGRYYVGNDTYTLSLSDKDTTIDLTGIGIGNSIPNTVNWLINNGEVYGTSRTFTNSHIVYYPNSEETLNKLKQRFNIQIEKGSVATPYEPYKSNILSTPEDLELRGIGEVQDTLNCLTGEVIESVGKILFDGSENMSDQTFNTINHTRIMFKFPQLMMLHGKSICSHTPIRVAESHGEWEYCLISNDTVYLQLSNSKLETPNVDGVRKYMAQQYQLGTPITIHYQLAEKVVKTVDLSGTPFGYKGGHIIKSSAEGSLLPKFEYEVAVSRGAQISQNTSTLIKHDEKITELLKKTAATYINQKAEIAYLLSMSSTLEEAQTIPFIEDDYVNDDCMVDSDMVMDNMEVEPEKEIIDNVDTLLINLIYDLIELNDTLGLSEKVELFRQSGLIDKHNYEIIKEKLNPTFKEEDYADINQ